MLQILLPSAWSAAVFFTESHVCPDGSISIRSGMPSSQNAHLSAFDIVAATVGRRVGRSVGRRVGGGVAAIVVISVGGNVVTRRVGGGVVTRRVGGGVVTRSVGGGVASEVEGGVAGGTAQSV